MHPLFTFSNLHQLSPLLALVAGLLILLVPKSLNYIVALYLILSGAFGLLRYY